MRQLKLTKQAFNELEEIKRYSVVNWGNAQAAKYLKKLKDTFELIQINPEVGQPGLLNWPQIYRLPVQSHMVYYQFDDQEVFVMAVLHQSMLPENHL